MIPEPAIEQAQTAAPLVDIIGELDANSTLAQLANARYAPESGSRPASNVSGRQGSETLSVLRTLPEARAAANEIAAGARRLASIDPPALEPERYHQTPL